MRVEEVQGTYEVFIRVMLLRPSLRTKSPDPSGTRIEGVSADGILEARMSP